jgi:signal transduction histidine kinase
MLPGKPSFHCLLKIPVLIMVAWCIGITAVAQSYTRNDSIQIYKWLNLADEESITGSLDTAIKYAKVSLQLSKEKKMARGEGFAKLKIADILFQQENDTGLPGLYMDALKIGMQLKDSFMMALTCHQQGQFQMYNGQPEEAERSFYKSLALKFGKEQSVYTALVYNDLGYLCGLKDELEKQADWYLKAIRIYDREKDASGLATTTGNLAAVYVKLGNETKALEFTRDAIAIRERTGDTQGLATSYENLSRIYMPVSLDSAFKYQQVAMRYAEKTGVKSFIMRSYDNLSVLMDQQHNKPEALAYIQKSIAICRQTNDKAGLAGRCRWAALLCGDIKDSVGMAAYFQETYQLSVQLNNKSLLRDFYGTRASYYRKINDFENAYENLKKYYAYRDSIVNNETATNIAGLQTKYETEKKDFEITRLSTSQKIKQLEIEKQSAVIAGNSLEAIQKENEIQLLAQQQELSDIRIKQQQSALQKQLLVAENNKKQLALAATQKSFKDKQLANEQKVRYLMLASMCLFFLLAFVLFNRYQLKKKLQQQAALEKMRTNIAADLHDDIGASLSNINILNELAKRHQSNPEKSNDYLTKAGEDIQRISESLGDIVWNINPRYDHAQNLFVRMKRYASDMMDGKNIEYEMRFPEADGNLALSMERRRDFYLVFKEAVNNVVKYSKATHAKVFVDIDNNKVRLTISDDGIGFSINDPQYGNGIYNMRKRAATWNDFLQIKSEAGKGTSVILEIATT